MDIEIWKVIPGFEDYEISNLGRVRRDKVLKLQTQKNGYVYAQMYVNTKRYIKTVHRLVMLTFVSESKLDVDHINGDKGDNRLSNLRYVTNRDNNLFRKGCKGYHRCKATGKWQSQILINGKRKFLGRFLTEEEAKAAYMEAYNMAINKNGRGEYI